MENARALNLSGDQEADLCINTFGLSVTQPGHVYGPAVRSYHLIHFILAGQGTFRSEGRCYHLHAGQGFLIEPDDLTIYRSDMEHPWTYLWVGFGGRRAADVVTSLSLTADNPIFSCPAEAGQQLRGYVEEMLRHNGYAAADTYYRLSRLFSFLAVLAHLQREALPSADSSAYISHILSYICRHIEEPFTVQELAAYMNFNRSYLTTLFKKEMGVSLHAYIQSCRLTKAQHLLETTHLSVEAVSCSCGYASYDAFTRAFKRQFAISPRDYRRQKQDGASLA